MEPPFWNFTFPHLTFSHVHTSQVAQVHIFNEILSTVFSPFDLRKMIWTYGDLDSTQNFGAVVSRGVLGSISPTENSLFEKNIGFWDPFFWTDFDRNPGPPGRVSNRPFFIRERLEARLGTYGPPFSRPISFQLGFSISGFFEKFSQSAETS